ncbi:hypothetical protein ACRAVF_10625 [Bradyrhizobium oligotrophicum S58]
MTIRPDGRVVHAMDLVPLKKPEVSKDKFDYDKGLKTSPGEDELRPLARN